jgi:GT2 family glycosyltransferase
VADLRDAVRRKATTFATLWRLGGPRSAFATGAASVRNSARYWSTRRPGRSFPVSPMPVAKPDRQVRTSTLRLSVVAVGADARPGDLRASLESVLAQTHESWELCVCAYGSGSDVADVLAEYRGSDPRLRILPPGSAHGPAEATNLAAEQASGEFLVLLDFGDELHPKALEGLAGAVAVDPFVDLAYTDEDRVGEDGAHDKPLYKPDWSPAYLQSVMYIGRGLALRKSLYWRLGGMRSRFDGANDYDLVLRASADARRIHHLPQVLYHRRGASLPVDTSPDDSGASFAAAREALGDFAAGLVPPATVDDGLLPGTLRLRRPLDPATEVTLVVLTADPVITLDGRGPVRLLPNLLDSVSTSTSFSAHRLLVVDDGALSDESAAALAAAGGDRLSFADPLRSALGFSFARKVNFALRHVTTDYVILLNDDLEILSPGWIEALLEPLADPGVAAAGARLLYPDGTVQHAGIVLGLQGGGAAHVFRGLPRDQVGYGRSTHVIREFSAVTGAVFAMRRRVFEELGGFDEVFAHDYQDVDFCARLAANGYRVVYTPHAEFVHFEGKSLTRGRDFREEDALFRARWPRLTTRDPYYNPNLPKDRPDHTP